MKRSKQVERHPLCGLLKRDLRKQGVEIQTWGVSRFDGTVYAGVHWVPELTARWVWKLHAHWARWRKWYDNLPENRKRDYPAKHNPQVVLTGAHPIAVPEQTVWLRLAS